MADAQMRAIAAVRKDIGTRDSASASKYLREFNHSFCRYETVLSSEQLEQRVTDAGILLVGDYHSLPASQHFTASLIEQISQQRPVVLGVEAVFSRDQQILDSWWRRQIGEDKLRQQLRFDREWGYEWEPFVHLLTSAREHCDGIYGLDCMPRYDLRRIRLRDRHAAGQIREIRQRHPNAVVVALFGESHMAQQHLPAKLRKLLPDEPILTVLQNIDGLYWHALKENAQALSIADDMICVFNSSPLEKYESYRLCLERWNAAGDDPPDFAPAVYNLIFSLARCLGFRLDSPHNGSQPKFLADSVPEVISVGQNADELFGPTKLAAELVGPGPVRRRIEQVRCELINRLEEHGCVYIPAANRLYVREFRLSEIAAEAARFLHHACAGLRFRKLANTQIEDALSYLGSRLLCPGHAEAVIDEFGESLYQAYLGGKLTRADLRQIFLGRIDGLPSSVPVQQSYAR
jgi:uncharacterized iron-regulated protein